MDGVVPFNKYGNLMTRGGTLRPNITTHNLLYQAQLAVPSLKFVMHMIAVLGLGNVGNPKLKDSRIAQSISIFRNK